MRPVDAVSPGRILCSSWDFQIFQDVQSFVSRSFTLFHIERMFQDVKASDSWAGLLCSARLQDGFHLGGEAAQVAAPKRTRQ